MADDDKAEPTPPQVILVGEAGFDPVFPKVGVPITYYWSEQNLGGAHTEPYNARVKFTGPSGDIDDVSVECAALATNEQARRETTLSAPAVAGIDYSIELWVDADHYQDNEYSEWKNYAYHTLSVDED